MTERFLKKVGRSFSWYNHGNALLNPVRDLITISAMLTILIEDKTWSYILAIVAMLLFVLAGWINSKVGFRRYQNEYETDLTPQIKKILEILEKKQP